MSGLPVLAEGALRALPHRSAAQLPRAPHRWLDLTVGCVRAGRPMQGLVSRLNSSQPAPAAPRYWLTVGIPTVPRAKAPNSTYLTTTLETLLDELPADPQGVGRAGRGGRAAVAR